MPVPRRLRLPLGLAAAVCASTLWGASARAAPTKVACVGEQTTHSDQLARTVEYPAMLQKELGAAYDVQNFGDCCATVLTGYPKQPETHPYLSGGSAPSYAESLTFAPDVVVIGSWGKHDTEIATALYAGVLDPVKFQADYETLVTTYLNLPSKPLVYLSTPVPIPKGQGIGPTTTVILPAVEAIAAKYHLPIVPLYPAFLNQPLLYKDDTHVANVAGLQLIADTVYAALTGAAPPGDGGAAGEGGLDDAGVAPPVDDSGGVAASDDAGSVAPGGGGSPPAAAPATGHSVGAAPAGCAMITPVGGEAGPRALAFFGVVALLAARRRRRAI